MSDFIISEFLAEKRDGQAHSQAAVTKFVRGCVDGSVTDYQAAAWLMAVYLNGMSTEETVWYTEALAHSGDQLNLSSLPNTVDKHSTGGVGDKTTLVLAPLLATLGGTVAKMSGRGLGHTGGTVDKLESLAGFRSELSEAEFLAQARDIGIVVTGQSGSLAPADGYFYALRDTTETVGSIPLIAGSIMSKKLASGAKNLVLDVKCGEGAFMQTLPEAKQLARTLVDIGRGAGLNVSALITGMSEPLGNNIGNALEVHESVQTLKGGGPADLREVSVALAKEVLGNADLPNDEARITAALDSGAAYETFLTWITAQGSSERAVHELPTAEQHVVRAPRSGFVSHIRAREIGEAVVRLGGGRSKKTDRIDFGVGLTLHHKAGSEVAAGEAIATIHHRGERGLAAAEALVARAYVLADERTAPEPLLLGRVQ